MQIEFLFFLILGIISGSITGLIPGLHTNNISILAIYLALLPELGFVFIVSMAISHSFVSFIPALFLGVPDTDTFVSLLPGHRLYLQGKGYLAVALTVFGGLIGGITSLATLGIYFVFIENFYYKFSFLIPSLLIFVIVMLIFSEKKIHYAIILVILSGVLGIFSLEYENSIMPIITGMFSSGGIIYSLIFNEKRIRYKQILELKEKWSKHFFSAITGSISGSFVSMMPGLGSAQAAFSVSQILKQNSKSFLVLTGSITTSNIILSFAALYSIGKTRSGAAIAINEIIGKNFDIVLFVLISITAIGLAGLITLKLGKIALRIIGKIPIKKLNITVLIFLVILSFVLSGLFGVFLFVIASAIGILPIIWKVKRSHLMAFLIIPILNGFFF